MMNDASAEVHNATVLVVLKLWDFKLVRRASVPPSVLRMKQLGNIYSWNMILGEFYYNVSTCSSFG
jgi:hypothetical protein